MTLKTITKTVMTSAAALLLGACAISLETGGGYDDDQGDRERSVAPQHPAPMATTAPDVTLVDGKYVVDATLPTFNDFILVETQMGNRAPRVVSVDKAAAYLSRYDVTFIGEAHGHVANHLLQSKIFAGIFKHHKNLALSMEQFERSQQHIVDEYLRNEIGEQVLYDDGKAWEHYRSSYRPLVEFAKANSLPVIAAEVPGGMVSCVGEEGPAFLDRLSGVERTWIADKLNTQDGPYKDRYMSFLARAAGHSVGGADMTVEEKAEKEFRRFAAQVSRDDTMAMSIFDFMEANEGAKVVHVNGSFHSAALLGTPERLNMRNPDLKLANIHPILVDDPMNPSFDAKDVGEGQYLVLIQNTPKRFRQMKNINAFVKRTMGAIEEKRCKY